MSYRFDQVIDRKGTGSLKYDFCARRGKPENVLPLWVADMDFKAPPAVIDALEAASRFGIFGYAESSGAYFEAVRSWYERRFGWAIKENWLVKTPGVVFAIHMAVRALTREGDAVLIQPPVYYPFAESVINNGRKLIKNPLRYTGGSYAIDFEDFEKKIVSSNVRLFIFCSPHNPVGRVWTEEELTRLGGICQRHGVYIVSDEIHADFVYPGHRHRVLADVKPEFSKITVTCTAPSKSFNLAGLQVSNILIPDDGIRRRFKRELERTGYSQLNGLGLVACRAAYESGQPWLDALNQYLLENLNYVRGYLRERIPQIGLVEPEGTYLLWLDFRPLGLGEKQLEDLVVNKAGLWLDGGTLFGAEGAGFERINIACPRTTLETALSRLETAVRSL